MQYMASLDGDRASNRNGVGFSGADTDFGHSLAAKPEKWWTPKMCAAAYTLLSKYRGQLSAGGLDFDAIPKPSAAPTERSKYVAASKAGVCTRCRKPFGVGDMIAFAKTPNGTYDRFHQACDTPTPKPELESAPYTDSEPLLQSAPRSQSRVLDILGPGGKIAQSLPGYEVRKPQLDLAQLIEVALSESRRGDPVEGIATVFAHVVAEAGTGTGKSIAYGLPAALSGKKVLISTRVKALQEQLMDKDLPYLQTQVPSMTFEIMKGRSNYVCLYNMQQAQAEAAGGEMAFRAPESHQQWQTVTEWVGSDECERVSGDIERAPTLVNGEVRELLSIDSDGCLGKKCPVFDQCYVERQKRRAASAQIVVANHNLVLIDAEVRKNTEGQVGVLPNADVLILDEAHGIEEVAVDAFGEEISQYRWLRLERALERFTRKHKDADDDQANQWMMLASEVGVPLMAFLEDLKDHMEERDATQLLLGDERPAAKGALDALNDLILRMKRSGAPKWLSDPEQQRWDKLAGQMEKFESWLRIAVTPEEGETEMFCRYMEREGIGDRARYVLKIKPIDVSQLLHDAFWTQFPSVIATSATLATDEGFRHWRKNVGATGDDIGRVRELVAASPFDYQKNAVLFVPQERDLPDPRTKSPEEQERYFDRLAGMMRDLIESGTKRAFLLFTSNRAMRAVHQRLIDLPSEWTVYVQGELPRQQIVAAFKETDERHKVLLATRTFFEGVDLQGDALTMVVLDKLPFPSYYDVVMQKKEELVKKRGGNPFAELMLPAAITTLKQASGRLIRTNSDYGVVAVLDTRLRTGRYGVKIVRALPPMRPAMGGLSAVREVYKGR